MATAAILLSLTLTGQARATIQLPIINTVTVRTSVSVPDSGGGALGGRRHAAAGRNSSPRGGAGLARAAGGDQADVAVTIMDFAEFEEQVSIRIAERFAAEGKTDEAIRHYRELAETTHSPDLRQLIGERIRELSFSPAAVRKQLAKDAEMMKKGREAESRGRLSLAKLFYKSAGEKGKADLDRVERLELALRATGKNQSGVASR